MHDQTTQIDDLQLVVLPSAVNCAEIFVRFTLSEWRLPSMVDEVADAARRLVRTVLDAAGPGGTGAVAEAGTRPPATITVRLRLRGGLLAVEVQAGRSIPRLSVPPALSGGRAGVDAVAGGGQLLWCELPLPTGLHATAVALPRRGTTRPARVTSSPDHEAPDVNVDVMQRILSSLNQKID